MSLSSRFFSSHHAQFPLTGTQTRPMSVTTDFIFLCSLHFMVLFLVFHCQRGFERETNNDKVTSFLANNQSGSPWMIILSGPALSSLRHPGPVFVIDAVWPVSCSLALSLVPDALDPSPVPDACQCVIFLFNFLLVCLIVTSLKLRKL